MYMASWAKSLPPAHNAAKNGNRNTQNGNENTKNGNGNGTNPGSVPTCSERHLVTLLLARCPAMSPPTSAMTLGEISVVGVLVGPMRGGEGRGGEGRGGEGKHFQLHSYSTENLE